MVLPAGFVFGVGRGLASVPVFSVILAGVGIKTSVSAAQIDAALGRL